MPEPPPEPKERRSFFTTLPGILTGIAALVTAIAGLVAIFVAPGSSTDGPAHSDWAKEANRLCGETADLIRRLPPVTRQNPDILYTTVPAATEEVRDLTERLRALPAPGDDEEAIDHLARIMDSQANEGDALVFAYGERNRAAVEQAEGRIGSLGVEIEESAAALGVSSCGQTPVPQGH